MIKKIIVFLVICISSSILLAQNTNDTILLYNNFESVDSITINNEVPLNSSYVRGEVKYQFEDSSMITPSGIFIKLYKLSDENEAVFIARTLTTSKGFFYFENISTGKYSFELSERNTTLSKMYFYIEDVEKVYLKPLIIPIKEVDNVIKQEEYYKSF